jgi:hypothetical protein
MPPFTTCAPTGVPANRAATSAADSPARYSRVPFLAAGSAPGCGGGPMIPPSANLVAPVPAAPVPPALSTAATDRVVSGAMALASTNRPLNPATLRATSSAACGGQTEKMIPARPVSSATVPTSVSPAAAARSAVAGPRPWDAHSTVCPRVVRHRPMAAPISPGCSRPTIASLMCFMPPSWARVPRRIRGARDVRSSRV